MRGERKRPYDNDSPDVGDGSSGRARRRNPRAAVASSSAGERDGGGETDAVLANLMRVMTLEQSNAVRAAAESAVFNQGVEYGSGNDVEVFVQQLVMAMGQNLVRVVGGFTESSVAFIQEDEAMLTDELRWLVLRVNGITYYDPTESRRRNPKRGARQVNPLVSLLPDLWFRIFSFLPFTHIFSMMMVCRFFNRIFSSVPARVSERFHFPLVLRECLLYRMHTRIFAITVVNIPRPMDINISFSASTLFVESLYELVRLHGASTLDRLRLTCDFIRGFFGKYLEGRIYLGMPRLSSLVRMEEFLFQHNADYLHIWMDECSKPGNWGVWGINDSQPPYCVASLLHAGFFSTAAARRRFVERLSFWRWQIDQSGLHHQLTVEDNQARQIYCFFIDLALESFVPLDCRVQSWAWTPGRGRRLWYLAHPDLEPMPGDDGHNSPLVLVMGVSKEKVDELNARYGLQVPFDFPPMPQMPPLVLPGNPPAGNPPVGNPPAGNPPAGNPP